MISYNVWKIIIDKAEVPIDSMIANYPTQQPQ